MSPFFSRFSEAGNPLRGSRSPRHQSRKLHYEPLEERQLLAVTATEFDAIRAQYADLNLSENMEDYHVIEITAEELCEQSLRDAILEAGTTEANDLIVVRTTEESNTVVLSGTELSIDINAEEFGSVTIVSLGEERLTIDGDQQSGVMQLGGSDNTSQTQIGLGGLIIIGGNSQGGGGGINAGRCDLVITQSSIEGNTARVGGGCQISYSTLTLSHSTIKDNQSLMLAGGLMIGNSEAELVGVLIDNNSGSWGAGAYLMNSEITGTDVTISNNTATEGGGGLVAVSSSAVYALLELHLQNSVISGNTSGDVGGGIVLSDFKAEFDQVIIENNQAVTGGGIYTEGTAAIGGQSTIRNSRITDNTSEDKGGGIYLENTNISLSNVLIADNHASQGAGIYQSYGDMVINNTTIANNTAEEKAGGIGQGTGGMTISNSIIAKNNASESPDIGNVTGLSIPGSYYIYVYYSLLGNAPQYTHLLTNNLIGTDEEPIDPLFVSIAEKNYRLQKDSPAVDAGNDYFIDSTTDLDGKPRKHNVVDMGAYEWHPADLDVESPSTVVTASDDIIDEFDGLISLREALIYANDGDTITFDASMQGKTILLDGEELLIDKNITIDATGMNITIDADRQSRVFNIAEDAEVVLTGLIISGGMTTDNGAGIYNDGTLTVTDCTISDNAADNEGAGVYNAANGNLTLTAGTVSGNTSAMSGGGITNAGVMVIDGGTISDNTADMFGGGILNVGTLTVTEGTVISGNTANMSGGGIHNLQGTLTLSDVTISGNTGGVVGGNNYGGGGIHNIGGEVTVTGGTISDNTGNWGGGIRNDEGELIVINISVTGNTATTSGGGIANIGTNAILRLTCSTISGNQSDVGDGGGIYNNIGTLTVTDSGIFENTSARDGGGIYNGGIGTVTLTNDTIAGNIADDGSGLYNYGDANLYNTIVAQNSDSEITNVVIVQGSNNLTTFEDWDDGSDNNYIYDPELPLFVDAENGDYRLAQDSQAIDKGNNEFVTTEFDLDGNPRIMGDAVDIGAYEFVVADVSYNAHDWAKFTASGLTENQVTWEEIDGEMRLTYVHALQSFLSGSLDLSGCTALRALNCGGNQLSSLDVSGCTALNEVFCGDNQLKSLDVSDCMALEYIWCSDNQLSSLDVSDCMALKHIWCFGNQLSSLDVSGYAALEFLSCGDNQLTSLDVSGCVVLYHLSCGGNLLSSLDVSGCSALKLLACDNNELASLDVSGCSALIELLCGDNQITSLDVSSCAALYHFYCRGNSLSSLNVSDCTALNDLDCSYNALTTLNVSGCTALRELYCGGNQISSLDVSDCTALKLLVCDNNELASLDISGCTTLVYLFCHDNQLTFSTLPPNEGHSYYPPYNRYDVPGDVFPSYAPQGDIEIMSSLELGQVLDISRESVIDGTLTEYLWYYADGMIVSADSYTETDGIFVFSGLNDGDVIYCEMTNAMFPDLTLKTTSVAISVLAPAELVTKSLVVPEQVVAGTQIDVSWIVANIGELPFDDELWEMLYITETGDLADGVVLAELFTTLQIEGDTEFERTETVTIPLHYVGEYQIILVLPGTDQLWAGNTITIMAPELTVTTDVVEITEGVEDGVTFTVTRTGDLSEDLVLTVVSDDTAALTVPETVTILAGEDSITFYGSSILHENGSGDRLVTVTVAAEYYVTSTIEIVVLDLTTIEPVNSGLSAPQTARTDAEILVSWWTTNQGNLVSDSEAWADNIYLSPDGTIENAILVGTFPADFQLEAGESLLRSENITIPAGLTGDYCLIVETVYEGNPSELVFADIQLFDGSYTLRLTMPDLENVHWTILPTVYTYLPGYEGVIRADTCIVVYNDAGQLVFVDELKYLDGIEITAADMHDSALTVDFWAGDYGMSNSLSFFGNPEQRNTLTLLSGRYGDGDDFYFNFNDNQGTFNELQLAWNEVDTIFIDGKTGFDYGTDYDAGFDTVTLISDESASAHFTVADNLFVMDNGGQRIEIVNVDSIDAIGAGKHNSAYIFGENDSFIIMNDIYVERHGEDQVYRVWYVDQVTVVNLDDANNAVLHTGSRGYDLYTLDEGYGTGTNAVGSYQHEFVGIGNVIISAQRSTPTVSLPEEAEWTQEDNGSVWTYGDLTVTVAGNANVFLRTELPGIIDDEPGEETSHPKHKHTSHHKHFGCDDPEHDHESLCAFLAEHHVRSHHKKDKWLSEDDAETDDWLAEFEELALLELQK